VPLFCRDWWLDAVAGEHGWDVAVVAAGEEVQAAMPYVVRRRLGLTYVTQPELTQHLGPWIRSVADSPAGSSRTRDRGLMVDLIGQLPPYDRFAQRWHHTVVDWLPFYWAGFSQTTRYTYRFPDLSDLDELWAGLRGNIRGDVRKAAGRFGLSIRTDLPLDAFWPLHAEVFRRQGSGPPHGVDLLARLDEACAARGCRRIFIAEDAAGRRHAGVYLVWDDAAAYYLLGGGDPSLRSSGATSLCLWSAIAFAATVSRTFDFEGSMIEPVERFFRAFGAEQTPYFAVARTGSRLLRVRECVVGLWNGK
jgi:hypothetical protein